MRGPKRAHGSLLRTCLRGVVEPLHDFVHCAAATQHQDLTVQRAQVLIVSTLQINISLFLYVVLGPALHCLRL